MKLLDDPCDAMVDRYPSSQCMQKNFDGYRLQNELCTAKCNNSVDGCCMHNCLFLENGLLVTGSLNRTLFSKWLSKTGDAEDPQILACIDQCENLGNETFLSNNFFHFFIRCSETNITYYKFLWSS